MKYIYILIIYIMFISYIDILFNNGKVLIYIYYKIKKSRYLVDLIIFMIMILLILFGIWINYHYKLKNDILGYCGAILGGGMTLLGVTMSISYNDDINKKANAMQYKPIVYIGPPKNRKVYEIDLKNNLVYIIANITNIGRAEAKNVKSIKDSQVIYTCEILPINVENYNILTLNKDILCRNKNMSFTIVTTFTDDFELYSYTLLTTINVIVINENEYFVDFNSKYQKL